MKAAELRDKTTEELQTQLLELLKEQFTRRVQKATGQMAQTHEIKQLRHDIARVKTVINEKAGE